MEAEILEGSNLHGELISKKIMVKYLSIHVSYYSDIYIQHTKLIGLTIFHVNYMNWTPQNSLYTVNKFGCVHN